jgi:putative protein-disulfide isomerase
MSTDSEQNLKLFYIYDALCGWCYGFSPVVQTFFQNHYSEFEFEVISGGMVRGNRIGTIGHIAPYISKAYKDVELRSGVVFGEPFLKKTLQEGTAIFTSEPAAIAMSTYKLAGGTKQVEYAGAIQKAIYYWGKEPEDLEFYKELAEEFGVKGSEYEKRYTDGEKAAESEFELVSGLGVEGFPSVIGEYGGKYYWLSRGYVSLEELEGRYGELLKYVGKML